MSNLYKKNQSLSQWSHGGAYLHFLHEAGLHKLITGVGCEFIAINTKEIALLDTGAELSIVSYEIYQSFVEENILLESYPVGKRSISTRLGNFEGDLYRVDVGLTADWGEPLAIEGTFLFCENWQGPTVLGFHGFLERIRFAVDPDYEQIGCIYFSET
jgi:hypothetical protein